MDTRLPGFKVPGWLIVRARLGLYYVYLYKQNVKAGQGEEDESL